MSNIVYIATSLDGYIARKDGNLDWLNEIPNPDQSDFGFAEFMQRIDGIVMGRHTFELVTGFDPWPYTKPLFVLSNSMKDVPLKVRDKAELVHGKLSSIIESLQRKGFQNLYIDGGKTIQSFLKEDLIDELILTRIPVVLGSGIPLFAEMPLELRFEHVETKVYNNMLVKSKYIRKH